MGERLDGDAHGAQRPYVDPLARTPGVGATASWIWRYWYKRTTTLGAEIGCYRE